MKDKWEKNQYTLADQYLDILCKNLPVVNRIINRYGDIPISEYLQQALVPKTFPTYQQRDDLFEVAYQYVAPLLGESVARRVAHDLAEHPIALATNHHGVDYFSHSIQGNIIFSLNAITGATSATTVPIFSFGSVPLNNSTYPRGLLLYHVDLTKLETMPKKLPLFPDRLKRCMVSVAPPFDQTMVHITEARFDKMVCDKQVSPKLADHLHKVFQEDYCHVSVLGLPNYSQQVVVLNNRIWKRILRELNPVPDIVYLESEKIASTLLKFDLSNPKSLAYHLMFDPLLREYVLEELDGIRGCWERKKLAQRLCMNNLNETQREKILHACGTVFFWGVDPTGRRIPLYLQTDASDNALLRGIDDYNNFWELPYTPQAIIRGLEENMLIPSLFTCFLTLAFARGIICVGGDFQGEYLPQIQYGVVTGLQKTPGYHNAAHLVANVPTNFYLDCMVTVMSKTENGYLIPAGTTEIIAGGGINKNDIEQMLSLNVREAHLAGLFETDSGALPPESRLPGWKKQLAADCSRLLKGKIVVK